MKSWRMVFVILVGVLFCFSGNVQAQPQMNDSENMVSDSAVDEDNSEYSYGTVKLAAADQISVLEYDYDGEQEIEMTYKVNENTKYENIASSTELVEGDSIEIYYEQSGEDKVATLIIKEIFEDENIEDDSGMVSGDEQEPVQAPDGDAGVDSMSGDNSAE